MCRATQSPRLPESRAVNVAVTWEESCCSYPGRSCRRFDWEMYLRGVKLVRYADDIVVFAKSKRAAERLLESCRKYLEGRLKLKMNTEKSKVTSIFAQKNFKFLGFCLGKNGNGIFIRAHRKSLDKAKKTLKLLTKRNRGRNVRRVMQEVKVFIRGWIGYF